MEQISAGALVHVATDGPVIDGIVFDQPSTTKVVVAVMDRSRGPVFRTVHPSAITERAEEGAGDHALQLLIRRTPPVNQSAARGGAGIKRGQTGHTRVAMHRTTGK